MPADEVEQDGEGLHSRKGALRDLLFAVYSRALGRVDVSARKEDDQEATNVDIGVVHQREQGRGVLLLHLTQDRLQPSPASSAVRKQPRENPTHLKAIQTNWVIVDRTEGRDEGRHDEEVGSGAGRDDGESEGDETRLEDPLQLVCLHELLVVDNLQRVL